MLQAKLRNRVFWGILIPALMALAPIEYFDLFDSALVLYGALFIFLALIIVYWFWWWHISKDKPSAMFLINGGLFVLIEWNLGWILYQRWMFIYDYEHHLELLNSNVWAYRILPEVVLMIWFFAWVIGRFYGERDYGQETSLPINDRMLFLKAQSIFEGEQRTFRDVQEMFAEAQRVLRKAQEVFSKAQDVFGKAQEVFNSRLNEHLHDKPNR